MATLVDNMPAPGGKTPPEDYPWEEWLVADDRKLHLARGIDYRVRSSSMRAYVYRFAKIYEVKLSTVLDPDGNGLTIRIPAVAATATETIGTAPAAGNPLVVR